MIIPIIMAIWLGWRARQVGRNWFGWALAGFFMPIVVSSLTVNFLGYLLSDGTMELAVELYVAVMVAGAVAGIVATVLVGRKALRPQERRRFETHESGPPEASENPPWTTDTTQEESHAETVDQDRSR